jgi:hypothetical protein
MLDVGSLAVDEKKGLLARGSARNSFLAFGMSTPSK